MEKCFKTRFSMQKRTRQRSINIPLSPNEDLEQGEERERERERERGRDASGHTGLFLLPHPLGMRNLES